MQLQRIYSRAGALGDLPGIREANEPKKKIDYIF